MSAPKRFPYVTDPNPPKNPYVGTGGGPAVQVPAPMTQGPGQVQPTYPGMVPPTLPSLGGMTGPTQRSPGGLNNGASGYDPRQMLDQNHSAYLQQLGALGGSGSPYAPSGMNSGAMPQQQTPQQLTGLAGAGGADRALPGASTATDPNASGLEGGGGGAPANGSITPGDQYSSGATTVDSGTYDPNAPAYGDSPDSLYNAALGGENAASSSISETLQGVDTGFGNTDILSKALESISGFGWMTGDTDQMSADLANTISAVVNTLDFSNPENLAAQLDELFAGRSDMYLPPTLRQALADKVQALFSATGGATADFSSSLVMNLQNTINQYLQNNSMWDVMSSALAYGRENDAVDLLASVVGQSNSWNQAAGTLRAMGVPEDLLNDWIASGTLSSNSMDLTQMRDDMQNWLQGAYDSFMASPDYGNGGDPANPVGNAIGNPPSSPRRNPGGGLGVGNLPSAGSGAGAGVDADGSGGATAPRTDVSGSNGQPVAGGGTTGTGRPGAPVPNAGAGVGAGSGNGAVFGGGDQRGQDNSASGQVQSEAGQNAAQQGYEDTQNGTPSAMNSNPVGPGTAYGNQPIDGGFDFYNNLYNRNEAAIFQNQQQQYLNSLRALNERQASMGDVGSGLQGTQLANLSTQMQQQTNNALLGLESQMAPLYQSQQQLNLMKANLAESVRQFDAQFAEGSRQFDENMKYAWSKMQQQPQLMELQKQIQLAIIDAQAQSQYDLSAQLQQLQADMAKSYYLWEDQYAPDEIAAFFSNMLGTALGGLGGGLGMAIGGALA